MFMQKLDVFLCVVLLAGCSAPTTSISDILSNPKDYIGKSLLVSGVVRNSGKIGDFSGYTLASGTRSISVRSSSLPAENSEFTVKGAVLLVGGILGGDTVYIEANNRDQSGAAIAQILGNPQEYIGSIVSVTGTVSESIKIGDWASFSLNADGKKIGVRSATLPQDGSLVTVIGAVGRVTAFSTKDVYIQATQIG
jgi:hypothetical protein